MRQSSPKFNSLPKIKTISFFAPHWELVFRGNLALNGYGVKTRRNDRYRHRGLVLCYTAIKAHEGPMRSYGLHDHDIPRGVVGCAMITDVRGLTHAERMRLFRGYNNLVGATPEQIRKAFADLDTIYAMDYGYFMKPFHRFTKPFVPSVQHMFGPIGAIPLYPEIERQLPLWALNQLSRTT